MKLLLNTTSKKNAELMFENAKGKYGNDSVCSVHHEDAKGVMHYEVFMDPMLAD